MTLPRFFAPMKPEPAWGTRSTADVTKPPAPPPGVSAPRYAGSAGGCVLPSSRIFSSSAALPAGAGPVSGDGSSSPAGSLSGSDAGRGWSDGSIGGSEVIAFSLLKNAIFLAQRMYLANRRSTEWDCSSVVSYKFIEFRPPRRSISDPSCRPLQIEEAEYADGGGTDHINAPSPDQMGPLAEERDGAGFQHRSDQCRRQQQVASAAPIDWHAKLLGSDRRACKAIEVSGTDAGRQRRSRRHHYATHGSAKFF